MSAISAAAGCVAYFQKGSRLIGYTLPESGCPARRCGLRSFQDEGEWLFVDKPITGWFIEDDGQLR